MQDKCVHFINELVVGVSPSVKWNKLFAIHKYIIHLKTSIMTKQVVISNPRPHKHTSLKFVTGRQEKSPALLSSLNTENCCEALYFLSFRASEV